VTKPHPLVLCVAGSSRLKGNSTQLLDRCIAGVESAGGRVDSLVLARSGIKACINCGGCAMTGECVLVDDMTRIYPRIDAADAIIVAAPIYFATIPATLKGFYDRCQPYWARRHSACGASRAVDDPARRPGAFLIVRAGGDPFGHSAAVTPTRSVFANLEVDYSEELVVEGPDKVGDILEYPNELQTAQGIGQRIVEAARRLASSKSDG